MKLTKRNYFSRKANKEFMSVSQFKAFSKCEHAALAEIKGKYKREMSTALMVGAFIDAYFEGEKSFVKFINDNNEAIFRKDGAFKAEYMQANEIINRILKDKLFMQYISGESQVIMTGSISGVPVKLKIDSLHEDKIVDLKIMKDFENVYTADSGSVPWFAAWEYDLQGAVYQEIVRQNTGKKLPFYLAAATKEKHTDIDIVHMNQHYLDYALDRFKCDVERYDAIKQGIIAPDRCEKCEYCKSSKVLTEPKEADEFYLI